MVEWPAERRQRLYSQRVERRFSDIPEDFRRELERAPAFQTLVDIIMQSFKGSVDPNSTLAALNSRIAENDAYDGYDDFSRQSALTLACIAALKVKPDTAMWGHLWSLARHSSVLENSLPNAIVSASSDQAFRQHFFTIARSVVEQAAQHPEHQSTALRGRSWGDLRDNWTQHPSLSSLFRGRFDHSFDPIGRADGRVLLVVADMDVAEFVRLLGLFDYPDPVATTLMWAGMGWRFERWKAVTLAAPVAFSEDSSWNGSLILPLLLAIARDQFRIHLRRPASAEEVEEATAEIRSLAREVASVLSQRLDAVSIVARWGNSLIRSAVASGTQNPVDARSDGFIDDAIFDALIAAVTTHRGNLNLAQDAAPWERWCHFATNTLLAIHSKTEMPAVLPFLDEWKLVPEDWSQLAGRALREHAQPFEGGGSRADGYGARLLSLPLVEHHVADAVWSEFWASTQTLREIVEFGDSSIVESARWESRSDASRLLMLQFSIGLMMMDHLISPPRPVRYERRLALRTLLQYLHEAVREMAAIDHLNSKFWNEAVRHLAIRRAAWLSRSRADIESALDDDSTPTLADFVGSLKGDTEQLLSLVVAGNANGVPAHAMANAFRDAGVDGAAEIALAKHLLSISQRPIGLTASQVEEAERVLVAKN